MDTGEAGVSEYLANLQRTLEEQSVKIGQILLTHWHHDHVGGLKEVLKLENVVKNIPVYKFPRIGELVVAVGGEAGVGHSTDGLEGVEITELSDGQVVDVDGASLKVIHTPGHTTDHVILHLEEENSVFSGDCILGEGTAVFEDLYDYMHSLQTILNLTPTRIYPGHGPVIEDPIPKIQYYIDHRNGREIQILECLQKSEEPLSAMDIVKKVYIGTPENLHKAAEGNVQHHLSKLYKEKKIKMHDSKKWVFQN